jgi:hypothetical protein
MKIRVAATACGLNNNSLTVSQKMEVVAKHKVELKDNQVGSIKQEISRVELRKMSNRIEKSKRNDAIGNFEELNRCVRQFLFPCNLQRESNRQPFILDFNLGFGDHFHIIIATRKLLDCLMAFGQQHFLSDSRYFGTSDAKVCHTTAVKG